MCGGGQIYPGGGKEKGVNKRSPGNKEGGAGGKEAKSKGKEQGEIKGSEGPMGRRAGRGR